METTANLWCEWEVRLMGRSHRPRPRWLGKKLREIRKRLEMSQVKMCEELDFPAIHPAHIAAYELDKREPPLPVILKYARLAKLSTDVLIDDDLDLPDLRRKGRK